MWQPDSEFTTRPLLTGTFGMVASTHWLASAAGMAALEDGGNAFDAAVAAGFVLQVVEPHMNGLGGEVPVIACAAGSGAPFVVAGQGPAPAAATTGAFAALGLDLVPGSGLLPATVPGAFGAWLLLARQGRLPLRRLLRDAVGYARDGYPLPPGAAAMIASMARVFTEHWPTSAEVYLAGGAPAPGGRFANPALAATYERLIAEGEAAGPDRDAQLEAARRAFYEGFVAEAVGSYLAVAEVMDATGARHRGLLTAGDLAGWRATTEPPARADFRGLTVCKTGPWGQGPVFLQQLTLLAGAGLADMVPGGAEWIHTVVECAKLAFADREAWYGDPEFTDVPLAELLSADYAAARRPLLADTASSQMRPGSPGGRVPQLPEFAAPAGAVAEWTGEPALTAGERARHPGRGGAVPPATTGPVTAGGGDTCHLDVVDRFGNVVTATPSGGWLHSSPVIPGLGFCLGTRGQMFTLTPELPNSLQPGKRPRTTLSPSLALREGEPYLGFGTPGGDQQDQWPVPFFLRLVLHGENPQRAIDAPAFHTSHFPSSFWPRLSFPRRVEVEERVGAGVIAELRERGHDVVVHPAWSLGRISAVARAGGFLYAAANPRGMQGYAAGR